MKDYSQLLQKTIGFLYPFIIIFGLYIIINGHKTPGGGFQGGAILASGFIINYLVTSQKTLNLKVLTRLEKLLYLSIIVFVVICVLYINASLSVKAKEIYLVIMNIFIGIKVCCGLSVVFFRFILFESR